MTRGLFSVVAIVYLCKLDNIVVSFFQLHTDLESGHDFTISAKLAL